MPENLLNKDPKTRIRADSLLPGRNFFLERPRIRTLLEKAVQNPVVFITAGGGFGKTCAVNSFIRQGNIPAVWITLSERDNDPQHFWENIVKAMSAYDLRTGKDLEEIGFPESPNRISRCFSILAGKASGRGQFAIVADNFHLIYEKSVLDIVGRLLSSPHPGRTIILISRREPELNTMALFSKGMLSRVTADDLSFNEEEIAAYFRLGNISLSREEAGEIFADTKGWILAISLIAQEMLREGIGYSRSLLRGGSIRSMIDSVFYSVPLSYQRFLVIISFLDQWPLEVLLKIVDTLIENLPPPEEHFTYMNRLSALYNYDVFLHGFRIHPLFLDYLREKQGEVSRQEIKIAASITAEWSMENRLMTDAAINYGIAGDYGGLLRAVYSAPRYLSRPAAASFLEIVEKTAGSGGREDRYFLFLRHVTRAGLLIHMERFDEARAALEESIVKFEKRPPDDLSSWILSACYNTLGTLSIITCHITRDLSRTVGYFERGSHYCARYPYTVSGPASRAGIGSYANRTGYPLREGEFERFIDTITRCIPYASRTIGGYLSGADSLCRAEFSFFRGDLNSAEQYAREAVFRANEKGQYEIENKGLFYLLRIYLCTGNVSAYRETRTQADAQLGVADFINRYVIYDIVSGWIHAHTGCPERIAPWLRDEYEECDLSLLYYSFETMVKAKCLFAEKRYGDALEFLERKKVREGLGSLYLGMLEITVLEAAIHSRLGDGARALKTLEEAYKMAVPGFNGRSGSAASFDMPFIELGEDMRRLAGAALGSEECGIPRPWLETVRNRASVYTKKLAVLAEQNRKSRENGEVPLLNSQELSILTGISRGLTREKIADNASLSISTVKNIIKIIYDKLDAVNRADAIRIATSLGILK